MTGDHTHSVLSLQDVSVSYGRDRVVNNVTMNVSEKSVFGLVGLNGVGKTTLIKTILGLRDQDEGVILVGAQKNDTPDSKKLAAYLPERFTPPWFLSGEEFLAFSSSLYNKSHADDTIYEESEALALDPAVLKRRVQTYSKGMRQKLGILSIVLTEAPLMILDEPMSGLDPRARVLVKNTILRLRERGHTVFFSSHILADVKEICDNVGVMDNGRIIFQGTPEALCHQEGNDNIEQAFLHIIDRERAA